MKAFPVGAKILYDSPSTHGVAGIVQKIDQGGIIVEFKMFYAVLSLRLHPFIPIQVVED